MKRKEKRKVSLFMLAVLIILLLALVGSGVLLYKVYRQTHSSAESRFANTPTKVGDLNASTYRFVSFLPILGQNNASAPVSYGKHRIIVGNLKNGDAVMAAISPSGAASWEVDLGGKLITCAEKAIDNELLPCLYHASDGNGVVLVNLSNGISKWIWLSGDSYINIATGEDAHIYLIGSDLSLTKIDQNGTQLDEVLLAQKTADKKYYPDTARCNFDETTLGATPESMQFLSPSILVLRHRGINYVLNSGTGDLLAAIPGKLVASEDKEIYTINPLDACTPSAVIYPSRNSLSLLPQNQFVPIATSLPNLIVQKNTLHKVSWKPFRIQDLLFPDLDVTLSKGLSIFTFKDIKVILNDGKLSAIGGKPTKKLWSFSDNFKDVQLAGDTLIYSTSYGSIKAVSVKEGAEIWELPGDSQYRYFRIENNSLVLSSPDRIDYYSFTSNTNGTFKGAPSTILKSQAGVFFDSSNCVRLVKKDKTNGLKYNVYLNKVSCNMNGAQEINGLIPVATLPRNSQPDKFLKYCNKTPDTTGAVTVSSRIDDPNIVALCTK